MLTEYPLTKANRIQLARAFRNNKRVDLSIDCVLEAQMGQAFVDDPARPAVFQIVLGPFCYLAGEARSASGIELIKTFPPYTFLMPSPPDWIAVVREIHGDGLEAFPRISFSAENLSMQHLESLLVRSAYQFMIERIDVTLAAQLLGEKDSFVDLTDFDSAQDFVERGIGYCVRIDGNVVGAAYSSLVCSRGIEVSIYVEPENRRKGMATALACALLAECLANGMEPH